MAYLCNYNLLPESTFEVNLFPHSLLVTTNNKGTFIAYKSLKTMIKAQNCATLFFYCVHLSRGHNSYTS